MSYHIDLADGVMTFTINRPHIRNAVNDNVIEGIEELILKAKQAEVQFVIVTAVGEQAFCSGGDLSIFHALRTEDEAYPMLKRVSKALYNLKTLPVPVIALVNGTAVGGGCEIATACDYRLVKEHAKCGFIQGNLAITSGWGGGTFLFEALKHDRALQMLGEARLYNAMELEENGWATKIVRSQQDIDAFLFHMKKIRPEVHRAYKEMAIRKWKETNLESRVEAEVRHCSQLWAQEAHHEAVAGFLNKNTK